MKFPKEHTKQLVQKIPLVSSIRNSKEYCLLQVEKQGNMQQQAEEHIRRSSPSEAAAADLNLIKGDECEKQNIYFILIWHKTQMWVKIFLRKF